MLLTSNIFDMYCLKDAAYAAHISHRKISIRWTREGLQSSAAPKAPYLSQEQLVPASPSKPTISVSSAMARRAPSSLME